MSDSEVSDVKKKLLIVLLVLLALYLTYFFGIGFTKMGSVSVPAYRVAEDGSEITLYVGVSSSAGFVRKAEVSSRMGGRMYVDFYPAFGGINGDIGARSRFVLPLDDDINEILVYRNENCYAAILIKDEDGIWQPVKH